MPVVRISIVPILSVELSLTGIEVILVFVGGRKLDDMAVVEFK
jgi:hypothetical protein